MKLIDYLEKSSRDHSHLCPRQILGVRMGLCGLKAVGLSANQRSKRLLVITETDGCFADGLTAATNCTVGHRTLRVEGRWGTGSPDSLPAGTFIVPTDQRMGMIAAFLLEPASEDGYTTWNFFDRGIRVRGSHPVRRLDAMPNVARVLVR